MNTTDSGELYILLDGTYASAGDCPKGDDGVMRGPSGVPVAMTDEGEPMTVKRQVDLGGNALAAEMGKHDDDERDMPADVDRPEAHEHVVTAETPAPDQRPADEKPTDERPVDGRLGPSRMT